MPSNHYVEISRELFDKIISKDMHVDVREDYESHMDFEFHVYNTIVLIRVQHSGTNYYIKDIGA